MKHEHEERRILIVMNDHARIPFMLNAGRIACITLSQPHVVDQAGVAEENGQKQNTVRSNCFNRL